MSDQATPTTTVAPPSAPAPAPAAAAAAKVVPPPAVVRRGRGAFTSGLKSDMPAEMLRRVDAAVPATTTANSANNATTTNAAAPAAGGGIANRVFGDLLAKKKADDAAKAAAAAAANNAGESGEASADPTVATANTTDDGYVPLTSVRFAPGTNAHPNMNKNKMNRPSATFAADGGGGKVEEEDEDGNLKKKKAADDGVDVDIKVTADAATAAAEEDNGEAEGDEATKGDEAEATQPPALSEAEAAAQQAKWEASEREDMRRARAQANEVLRAQAEAFDDGELHPLTVASVGGGAGGDESFDHALNTYGHSSHWHSGANGRHYEDHVDPLLVSPVLTCSRFAALKKFFLNTFYDLWCLEDNKSQKVSIKLEFGKAFYTRSSRASSFSSGDLKRQTRVPFTDFVSNLNKETSQMYFINDAPLTVARGLDAIGDARERANYTLVKIFFFSKERQSHIVVRAIWDQQFDCFELTDVEHIGITFSWLVLNMGDVPEEEQSRTSAVGGGEGVFLRHALPVEVQFRAFQRKKTIVGHPLEKKAKFILRKLTAAEHDRLRHGYGSYDSVDFHAIARTEKKET